MPPQPFTSAARRRLRLFAAALTGVALACSPLFLDPSASSAQDFGDVLDPERRIGDLALVVEETNVTRSARPMRSATTTEGCPVGFRESSMVGLYFAKESALAPTTEPRRANTPNAKPGWGLTGSPMSLDASDLQTKWSWHGAKTLVGPDGLFTVVVLCSSAENPTLANSKYFSARMAILPSGRIGTPPPAPVERTSTTTTLTAVEIAPDALTLRAQVAPGSAKGQVQFSRDGADIGGSVAVSDGIATLKVTGLTPATEYSFTAKYGGDDGHQASEGTARVTTAPAPVTPSQGETGVTVVVPAVVTTAPTGLTLAVTPKTTSLTGPDQRAQGAGWQATGKLGEVVINDDRRKPGAKWTLYGKATEFKDGEKAISASSLGWRPEKVSGPGTAGVTVPPRGGPSSGGLGGTPTLISGEGGALANVRTVVNADLTLDVAQGIPSGSYSSTLTLTLV